MTLVPPETADHLGYRSAVARDSRGTIAVATSGGKSILLFDRDGRFVRQFGRTGSGPGEFMSITNLEFSAGDSLYVFDGRRLHVFSPTLTLVRTRPLPAPVPRVAIGRNGSMIASARLPTADGLGYPVHIIDASGTVTKSFGRVGQQSVSPDCRSCDRTMHPGLLEGHVSLSFPNTYGWEVWDVAGSLTDQYQVSGSPWFKPWTDADGRAHQLARSPTLSTIAEIVTGPPGYIIVRGNTSPPGWKPQRLPSDAGINFRPTGDVSGTRDALNEFIIAHDAVDNLTVFDVIDLRRRQVVASSSVLGVRRWLAWPYSYSLRALDDGQYVIDVFQAAFRSPPPANTEIK